MFRLLVVAITFVLAGATQAADDGKWKAGDAAKGKAKSATCVACHGATGTSANPLWPNLCSQKDQYMFKQLVAFKNGGRKDPLMAPMSAPLSFDDMRNLSTFFAAQKCK